MNRLLCVSHTVRHRDMQQKTIDRKKRDFIVFCLNDSYRQKSEKSYCPFDLDIHTHTIRTTDICLIIIVVCFRYIFFCSLLFAFWCISIADISIVSMHVRWIFRRWECFFFNFFSFALAFVPCFLVPNI